MSDNIIISNNTISRVHNNKITTASIEKDLIKYPYKGQGLFKDEEVEKAHIPYFAMPLYYFIFNNNRIPSPEEYEQEYFNQSYFKFNPDGKTVSSNFDNKIYNSLSIEGIKARLLRTYPSHIRDIHFYNLCLESNKFETIEYSLKEDLFNGNDLAVTYNNKKYNIALMVKTKRSIEYLNAKQSYRHEYQDRINLELDLSTAYKVGNYMLYDNSYVDKLLTEISKRETN